MQQQKKKRLHKMSYQKSPERAFAKISRAEIIAQARGERPCDLVIKGAQWLDVFQGQWRQGDIAITAGLIIGIGEDYEGRQTIQAHGDYVVPGFIDAHVHIESSLMTPRRFAEAVLPRGTTSVIWDPHEIANVWGSQGIQWALDASENLELCVFVMVPSCVPSTTQAMELEQSGAVLKAKDLRPFRSHPRVLGLAEMMNFPGLLSGDKDVMAKLYDFQGMLRDGHCPSLKGKDLNAYGAAGIHSCHESTSLEEAGEKLTKGIHVLIREGSCAKNAKTLLPLLTERSAPVLGYCSDDRNPLDIEEAGHIDCIIDMALKAGKSPVDIFRAASFGPARMYQLYDRGALAPGYWADLVRLRPRDPKGQWASGIVIQEVLKKGRLFRPHVSDTQKPQSKGTQSPRPKNSKNLKVHPKLLGSKLADVLKLPLKTAHKSPKEDVLTRVIGVIPQQIITKALKLKLKLDSEGRLKADVARDILKICVIERHFKTLSFGLGLVQGFGLKSGAIATSINHDSHNIIIVGSSDEVMIAAYLKLLEIDGGIVCHSTQGSVEALNLPFGGLMTDENPHYVASALRQLKTLAQSCGCVLEEPFLQLSFLALPVIGDLKITDKGLVDVQKMAVVPLECETE